METKIVTVNLDAASYEIYIGSGLLYRVVDFVPTEVEGKSVFIVSDTHVRNYAESIQTMMSSERRIEG
jgi:3-dehydroquinate synthetase